MVGEEIQKAKDLFTYYGERILHYEKCAEPLKVYRESIDTTWEKMEELDVIRACAACSDKWKGGCCFLGVENWYDHTLFLVNLLLGVDIPESRTVTNGCMFVGPTGCSLLARHSFCINYFCGTLKCFLSMSDRKELMSVAGAEIFCGIQVEQSIKKWIEQNKI